MKKLTATKAIEYTLEGRLLELEEGIEHGSAVIAINKKHGLKISFACPMCQYSRQQETWKSKVCGSCPIVITTGASCGKHDPDYHHYDPQTAISLILYVQYEWERRYSHRKEV